MTAQCGNQWGEEERDTSHVCVFLGCIVIRFVVVVVMVPILTLLRWANVWLSQVLVQIEGGALRKVDDRVQRRYSAPDIPENHAWILAFRVGNISDGHLLGELSGHCGRA